jgi:hypothetical protein
VDRQRDQGAPTLRLACARTVRGRSSRPLTATRTKENDAHRPRRVRYAETVLSVGATNGVAGLSPGLTWGARGVCREGARALASASLPRTAPGTG